MVMLIIRDLLNKIVLHYGNILKIFYRKVLKIEPILNLIKMISDQNLHK